MAELLIDGELRAQTVLAAHQLFSAHFGGLRLGRFSHISVTGDMKEKGLFPYTDRIEKAEAEFRREISDVDRMRKLVEEHNRE